MNEKSLRIIFTKKLFQLPDGKSKPKPVMFWIHGGGFTMGSSNTDIYGPEYLITGDIVLVSLNYRLGIFGKYLQHFNNIINIALLL